MKTRILTLLCLSVIFSFLVAVPVWEEELPVRLGKNIEWWSRSVYPSRDGNSLLLWSTTESGQRDIKIAKLNVQGEHQWTEGSRTLFSHEPAVWIDNLIQRTDDGYALLWTHMPNKNATPEPFLSLLSEEGELIGETGVPLAQNASMWTHKTRVLSLPDNRTGVMSSQDAPGTYWDLYFFLIEADGSFTMSEVVFPDSIDARFRNAVNIGDNIYIIYGDDNQNYFQLYQPGTGLVWDEGIPCPASGYVYDKEFFAADDAIYLVDTDDDITLHRFDLACQSEWSTLVADDYAQFMGAFASDDGSVVLGGFINSAVDETTVYRYLADGSAAWSNPVVALLMETPIPYIVPDGEGGCYIYTIDWVDDSFESYLQHVTVDGSLDYPTTGFFLGSVGSSYGSGVPCGIAVDGHFGAYFVTYEENNDRSLCMQSWQGDQQCVPDDNRVVDFGPTGWAWPAGGGSLGDTGLYYSVWHEDRNYDGTVELYMQTFDVDGNVMLEENGRLLCVISQSYGFYAQAFCNSNGTVFIAQREDSDDVVSVVVRLFTSEGLPHPTTPVVELFTTPSYPHGTSYSMDNDILTVCLDIHGSGQAGFMKMQQVNEDGALWAQPYVNGVPSNYYVYLQASGSYILWRQNDYTADEYTVRLIRVENGQSAPGWPDSGLVLVEDDNYSSVSIIGMEIIDEDVYFVLRRPDLDNPPIYNNYLYKVSADGDLLFGEDGMFVGISESYYYGSLVTTDAAYVALCDNDTISVHKVTTNGARPWGNEGVTLATLPESGYIERLAAIDRTNFVCTWIHCEPWNNDLYFVAFDSEGDLYTPLEGDLLADGRGAQRTALFGSAPDGFVAIWSDERTSNLVDYGDYCEVFAQRFDVGFVGVEENSAVPASVLSIAPNPFNPTTTIAFSLAEPSHTTLCVYNVRGQLVKRVVNEPLEAGVHSVVWDGRNSASQPCASGVYFCRLQSGGMTETCKMLLLK
ncbi:MAG: T9SS type A sorting domain-containing protein [Candidatus Cloacimonetes bacterium]|nr:T9SS type A sorting domain-containing protein [Candidatus Cloacimonadota bacterium]